MSLSINTNVAALTAHRNMVRNDNNMTTSLTRLSTGLRINSAADDASGLTIADSLAAQADGLGQGIRNANDGVSIVQTADGALEESVSIVNTIKTKAIQAASGTQTTATRSTIQEDIDKLLEELDNIATTTSFNGMQLLNGTFTNKVIQTGASANETASISIGNTESNAIGHISTADLDMLVTNAGSVQLTINSIITGNDITLEAIDVGTDSTEAGNGLGALADEINTVTSLTGVSAVAVVQSETAAAIAAGTTGDDFEINGVVIGSVNVIANDADGSLVTAINSRTSETGVSAAVTNDGKLTMTSEDGRIIEVAGTLNSLGTPFGVDTVDTLSTLGEIHLTQKGSSQINVTVDVGTATVTQGTEGKTLADISVMTQEDAQVAITIAESALADLDATRSSLGSVENQLTSTIANLSVTRTNVTASESTIRDVDFAEETSNYARLALLAQTSSYALSQANAASANITSLLQ